MSSADASTAGLVTVQSAYDSLASAYIDAFGSADKASVEDRMVMTAWSTTLSGPVLDAGCGPGHWSAFLSACGLEVEGIDATAAFVEHARHSYPDIPFRLGDLRTLALVPGSLGGVLAWFSLIHLDPHEVPDVVQRFSEALRPGGTVLLGFFSGDELRAFDHRVVTAWTWPVARMRSTLERAGLEVVSQNEHPQPSGRVFAEIVARRPGHDGLSSLSQNVPLPCYLVEGRKPARLVHAEPVVSRGESAEAVGGAGSWNLRVLDADGNEINSVGLVFYGDRAGGDALDGLTTALARMKYKRLTEWHQSYAGQYTARVERF